MQSFRKKHSSGFRLREIKNGTKSVRNLGFLWRNPKRPLPKVHIRIITTPCRRYFLQKSSVICFHSANVWQRKTKIQEFTSQLESGNLKRWRKIKTQTTTFQQRLHTLIDFNYQITPHLISCLKNYWSPSTKAVKHFTFTNSKNN
jgi:hypothetical protein